MTSRQRKLWMRTGAAFGFFVLFGGLILLPQLRDKRQLSQEVKQLQEDGRRTRKVIETSYRFGERLQDILDQLEYYRNQVPSLETLPGIVDEIATLAQDHELKVLSLQPIGDRPFSEGKTEASRTGQNVQERIFGMHAQGTYMQVGRYLSRLETGPYAILVKEVDVKNQNAVNPAGDPILDIQLKLSILMTAPPVQEVKP